ncbi:uncharacterized protein LOC116299687 isoform X1 [Actinia tenebrosa]|uniref:Uncharacterized protein LOC116299687 isoform X1 n=1 Tax=Actinia tenebrosa TaxID=6105 RepID=A0A6P8I6S6_ACTTE|nr:uncharacterized protein LOC116299687 isoform X1 [Actinia tenebrosa]
MVAMACQECQERQVRKIIGTTNFERCAWCEGHAGKKWTTRTQRLSWTRRSGVRTMGKNHVSFGCLTCLQRSYRGERYGHSGGGANYVCLPETPKYGRYKNGYQNTALMYGTEYEVSRFNQFTRNLHNHDAPCAVCYVTTRSTKMMIPATYACPSGWTREYNGYLMSERYKHSHSSNFICVDQNAEAVPGTIANREGALLYPVEGVCGSLPCLPYVDGRELTCAVCSK